MKNHVVLRILSSVGKYKGRLILSLLFAVIQVLFSLLIPILVGDAIDLITKSGFDFDVLSKIILQVLSCIAFSALSQWLLSVCNNAVAYNCVRDLRKSLFVKTQKLDLSYIDSHSHGEILSLTASDVDQVADGLIMGFSQLFTGVLTIFGTLGIMLYYNWKIALVVVFVTPLSLFVAKFISGKTHDMFKKQSQTRAEQTGLIDEMVGNLKTVKAFAREEANLKNFDEINSRLNKCSLKAVFFSSLTNPCTRFVNSVVYACVAAVGALAVIMSPTTFTVGLLSCFLNYANQYTKPFNEISGVITELQNAFACAARIYDYIDLKEQTSDKDSIILENANGDVSFETVSFSYNKDKQLIKDLSLSVKKGMHVAIVGPTGCGKTTLINLLMRFYDVDRGDIKVDNVSVYSVTRHSLRNKYGMVLQDTWLRSGTIRDNIVIGKPDATDEEVIEAAKATHAHSFIKRLPEGYNTVIGEDGGSLSQGQKQLLCITRIMLSLPPMLILDEATSSIDTRTEKQIQRAFSKLTANKTSFVVAHRLSTIIESDLILVMKDGNVIEQGTHTQLLQRKGFYYELYNSQFVKA